MERLKLRYTFYVFVKTVSVLTSLMPMFLFWSQVSNCWWLCELSSHLFRLPRVGHIPSQKLVLPRQDQSPPPIGPSRPVLLSHWRSEAQPGCPVPLALFFNCAMVYKFLSNSFPSCNSREISRSWSENIQNRVSKSGPPSKASQPELLSEDAGISSPCGPLHGEGQTKPRLWRWELRWLPDNSLIIIR